MCNKCIHKIVCSKYIATGGVRKCKHYRTEHKERWLLELQKINYRWEAIAKCPGCKAASLIWAGNFVGVPDDIARQIAWDNADSVELSKFCPNCGADMRGTEDG